MDREIESGPHNQVLFHIPFSKYPKLLDSCYLQRSYEILQNGLGSFMFIQYAVPVTSVGSLFQGLKSLFRFKIAFL